MAFLINLTMNMLLPLVFVIPFFLKTSQHIIIYAALLMLTALCLIISLFGSLSAGDDGPGYILAFGYIGLFTYLLLSGSIAKLLILKLKSSAYNKVLKRVFIAFAAVLGPIVIIQIAWILYIPFSGLL